MHIVQNKIQIFKWLILWLGAWGISQWLWGGDPLRPSTVPGTILIIFLVALALAFILFPKERKVWLSRLAAPETLVILLSIVAFSLVDQRPLMNNLLTSAHVLFQQLMIAVLVFMKPSEKFSQAAWRVIFFFGASHLLLSVFMSWPWTLLFSVLASITGVVFAYLIQRIKYGITISFIIHLGFYLIFFNLI